MSDRSRVSPAFPCNEPEEGGSYGMSMREFFTGLAFLGLIINGDRSPRGIAEEAIELGRAMTDELYGK